MASEESYALAAEMLAPRAGRKRYLLRVVGQSVTGAGIEVGNPLRFAASLVSFALRFRVKRQAPRRRCKIAG